jgi:uncharacterized protein
MGVIVAAPARRVLHRLAPLFALLAVLWLTLGSLTGCAWLDLRQRQMALRPSPGVPQAFAAGSEAERVNFQTSDRRWTVPVEAGAGRTEPLALWWLPHADSEAPTLLYLHGTFRSLYGNLPKISALRQAGFSVLAVDYRGWGESAPIVPSEATIASDARMAWDELVRRQPQPLKRVIFGHSMGGAVAVRLASELRHPADYGALVLESTFTRMPDVAAAAGLWGRFAAWLTSLEFDSLARIQRIDAPLLMLHGDRDNTVPVELGRRLRDAAPPGVRWVEFAGGSHSRLQSDAPEQYQKTFKELMSRLP